LDCSARKCEAGAEDSSKAVRAQVSPAQPHSTPATGAGQVQQQELASVLIKIARQVCSDDTGLK